MNRMDAVHSRLFVLLGWLVTMGCVVLCPIVGLGDTMRPPAPFDDLDILGPFAGLAYSKVEGPTKMTLANLLVNWLPDVLPGMPRGEAIGGGRWRHSPPTDAAGRILGRPEWVERSIEYAVFAFASPEQAVGVMEGLFGHEGQRAWETWSDERRQYALDNEPVGTYGGPLTAQEWRATNYVTAFSWEKTGIGNNSWSEVIVYSNATATWEHFEFVVRTARTFAGNRDLGGSDYTTVAIAGEWKNGEERTCFIRRGQHILAVTVALWAGKDVFDETGTKLDHTIFHNPPFPADLWNQVLAIVGHDSADARDPVPTESREELEKQLSTYQEIRDELLQSIGDKQKQIDALNKPDPRNTGYFNEYQNNTLGNDPHWNKEELEILEKGYPGVLYLYNKDAWARNLDTQLKLQQENLAAADALIADIQRRLRDLLSREEGGS